MTSNALMICMAEGASDNDKMFNSYRWLWHPILASNKGSTKQDVADQDEISDLNRSPSITLPLRILCYLATTPPV